MIRITLASILMLCLIFSSCSEESMEKKDLIIKYIDEFDQKLRPLEHESSFIHGIKNIESESEQLAELGKLILSGVLSEKKYKEDNDLTMETQRLYEMSTKLQNECKSMSENAIKEHIKEIRQCYNNIRSSVRKITDSQE